MGILPWGVVLRAGNTADPSSNYAQLPQRRLPPPDGTP